MSARELITEHLVLWTGAVTKKSSSGRGSNGKVELTGIKKLRELVLELAVRGKLVDQSQEDEPSSELLEKIFAEKTKRIESGEIKKPKKLPAIEEAELPFQIPATWKFIRLGDAVDIIRGITFPASEKSKSPAAGRLACLRTTNVQDTIEVHDLLYIKESFVTKKSQYIQKNDIVMSMANSRELVGKVAFVEEQPEEPMTFGGFLGVLRPTLIHAKFLMAVLRAPHSREALIGNASQTTNIANISIGKLNPLVLGLPPIEEQHRIVQKVDELMALCDRLEQQTSDQLEAHETLVDTLLGTLTQSENATELADNWTRLAAHFDTLFTTEQSIDKLKQTILQLAVMGRLVEQNFSSENSSELLQKIESKREQLVQQGKLKDSYKRRISEKTDTPFKLPANWSWVRISDLLPDFQNGASSRGDEAGSKVIVLRLADITNLEITLNDPRRLLISNNSIRKYAVRKGDILIIRVNGSADLVGRFVPVEGPFDGIFCDHFIRMRTDSEIINPRFFALTGSTSLVRSRIEELFVSTAGQKTINQKHISSLLTPIPPIEEQHRIVQKVDELMALCDQLKERLNQASETRCQLAESVVEGALKA